MEKETKNVKVDYSKMNIYKKKALASILIGNITKSKEIGVGKASYQVATEGDILPKINEVEEQLGLTTYAKNFTEIENTLLEREQIANNGQVYKTYTRYTRLVANMVCVNLDNPEEKIEFNGFGEAMDIGDKASGKAQTYANKYALIKFYKLTSGLDSDNYTSVSVKPIGYTLNQIEMEIKKQGLKNITGSEIYNVFSKTNWKLKNGTPITDLPKLVKAYANYKNETKTKEIETKDEMKDEEKIKAIFGEDLI